MQKNFSLVWKNTSHPEVKKQKKLLSFPTSELVKKIIHCSNEIKNQTIVIKLDSTIIENDELLINFAENINILSSCGAKIVIVHDYSKLVESSLKLFGIDNKIITEMKSLNYQNAHIAEMVLSGYVNKLIVSKLCEFGCYAIGISGKDGNLIQAKTSKSLHKRELDQDIIDIGFVSEPIVINPEILLNFEDMDIIPVISPIACDENQRTHILDVNLTASVISSAIGADYLVLLCDGTFMPKNNLCSNIKINDLKTLKNTWQGVTNYKMQSLFRAAYNSIESNANSIFFVNANLPDALLFSFFSSNRNS